jgi:NAD-dependent SIR2 family protein deacetylase
VDDTVLFAGAGLSAVAGLPTTKKLTEDFLSLGPTDATARPLQSAISRELREYWEKVFGYVDGGRKPSFEDHFTALDLSANSGHNLGTQYSPKKLRAIRRLSIHRVFDIINTRVNFNHSLNIFFGLLADGRDNSVVTTNWDMAIEKALDGRAYNYSIPTEWIDNEFPAGREITICKLHGSANWAYCDCCSRLFASRRRKDPLYSQIFIDDGDFRALRPDEEPPAGILGQEKAMCRHCAVRLSSRVATFSYAKTLDSVHFVATWDQAFRRLRDAKQWVFVGYSFPDADFELRHLLKAAQLGRADRSRVRITVVLRRDYHAAARFKQFFGNAIESCEMKGFDEWVNGRT